MGINLSPYQGIFGMPPPAYTNHEMIRNSMPVLEITPGEPNFRLGLTLFNINTIIGWKNYKEILDNHGFTIDKSPLKFAFIADNFPTDTFTNEYTETFLQKFTDVASSGLSQLVQMSGQADALRAAEVYGQVGVQAGKDIGGTFGAAITKVSQMGVTGAQSTQNFVNKMQGSDTASARFLGGGMNLVNKMLAGHRIDFPQIWSNSGYSPSYSVTIRLYNPNPGNKNSTLKYIAGPLCAILCLAVPRTVNGASYRWPFYHRMRVQGLYELDPAVITNVTVIKGGDQQQLAFNQTMSICDIRIDFISLHKSMLLEEKGPAADNRPTVRRYIKELTNGRAVFTRANMNNINNDRLDINAPRQQTKPQSRLDQAKSEKNLAAATRLPQSREATVIEQTRVAQAKADLEDLIIETSESGTYVKNITESIN